LVILGLAGGVQPTMAQDPGATEPAAVAHVWTFDLASGESVEGNWLGLTPNANPTRAKLQAPDTMETVVLEQVVQGFAHPSPLLRERPEPATEVHLVGGEVLRGELRGGDEAGEFLLLDSHSLGSLQIKLDRIALILFLARSRNTDPAVFRRPREGARDETLFQRSGAGIDPVDGIVTSFKPKAVVFEWSGDKEPVDFGFERLVALTFRNGQGPARQAALRWLLRDGSLLDGDPTALVNGRLGLRCNDEVVRHADLSEVLAVCGRPARVRFLSDLTPTAVEEVPYLGEGSDFLFPHRRDRAVSGGYLAVTDRFFLRGIGCHAKTVLTYAIPPGAIRFTTRVGIDDEARSLAVPGNATFRVRVDGEPVHQVENVKGGCRWL
jgi:hypothetical protein